MYFVFFYGAPRSSQELVVSRNELEVVVGQHN